MNFYTLVIIVGIVLQVGGVVGYLMHTKVELTVTEKTVSTEVVVNETGNLLSVQQQGNSFYKQYKLVKRN